MWDPYGQRDRTSCEPVHERRREVECGFAFRLRDSEGHRLVARAVAVDQVPRGQRVVLDAQAAWPLTDATLAS